MSFSLEMAYGVFHGLKKELITLGLVHRPENTDENVSVILRGVQPWNLQMLFLLHANHLNLHTRIKVSIMVSKLEVL